MFLPLVDDLLNELALVSSVNLEGVAGLRIAEDLQGEELALDLRLLRLVNVQEGHMLHHIKSSKVLTGGMMKSPLTYMKPSTGAPSRFL